MTQPNEPATLGELLLALEKSDNLRGLARECGLTVRELRRRLGAWRRELAGGDTAADAAAPAAAVPGTSPLPARGSQVLEIWTDGASRGNPGPAAIGIVFSRRGGTPLCAHAETIGIATNNVAEYTAVLRALEFARSWGAAQVDLYLDSELIARQLTGVYRVKSLDLRPLHQQVVHLARELAAFRVRHVARERNRLADRLANLALDGRAWARG